MPSILIVEDHDYMALVLKRLLQKKGLMNVAKEVSSAEEALAVLPALDVDLVLVDISLPKMNGIDLVIEIKKAYPELPCLMLSGHQARDYVTRSLAAGASGYISKQNTTAILEGVECVLRGDIYLSQEISKIYNDELP
jgi:DNA-binding NarL/FixJ family response regulator